MIKNFPFCDYYKKHRDASSFDLASYYSAVSSNGTYINRQITQSYNKTKYFLIDFSRSTQYYFHFKKMSYWGYSDDALIFKLYNQDKQLLATFQQTATNQQYGYYAIDVYFYFKITNGNILFYSKNETTNVTSYNVELTGTDKFYMVVYPNIQKMTITPATTHFVDNSKTFNVLDWENRQQNIFARKYSDVSSCGSKANIYPKDDLLFYFDFQDNEYQYLYNEAQTYREYVAQNIPAQIGDYNLHVVSSSYDYAPYPYLIRTTGFKNQGAQFYGSTMPIKSNFNFQYNFQQFTLCSYIKRTSNYPNYVYDLLTYGYGEVYDYSNSDDSNKNKGFGFCISDQRLGVRFNANRFSTDCVLQIGSWSFICLTYDKQYLRCYLNGIQIFQQEITQSLEIATKFYVGTSMDSYDNKYYNNQGSCYNYVIDQLACFSKCLNSFYIKTMYDTRAVL